LKDASKHETHPRTHAKDAHEHPNSGAGPPSQQNIVGAPEPVDVIMSTMTHPWHDISIEEPIEEGFPAFIEI
jgi:hypothetical protein